jgi:predicted nucleotidyltransferase
MYSGLGSQTVVGLDIASVESYNEAKEIMDLCVEDDVAQAYLLIATAALSSTFL